MIEFIQFYKDIKNVKNDKELFAMSERFLRESKISCVNNRINLIEYLYKHKIIPQELSYRNVLYRVTGFFKYIMVDIEKEKSKIKK